MYDYFFFWGINLSSASRLKLQIFTDNIENIYGILAPNRGISKAMPVKCETLTCMDHTRDTDDVDLSRHHQS